MLGGLLAHMWVVTKSELKSQLIKGENFLNSGVWGFVLLFDITQCMCIFSGLFVLTLLFSATLKSNANIDTSLMRISSWKIRILCVVSFKRNWSKREILLQTDLVYLRRWSSFLEQREKRWNKDCHSMLLKPTPSFTHQGVFLDYTAILV